jgi:hypothetical protein
MPCRDVTEFLSVVLDPDERLVSYSFGKQTCGQGIGVADLLLPALRGYTVNELLALSPETVASWTGDVDEIEEFLALKHFIALQSALEVYTGRESTAPDALCSAAEITADDDHISLHVNIRVDIVTEKIRACGHCRSCGRSKKQATAG